MSNPDKRGERTIALALLGIVLFSKPVLEGIDADGEHFLFGIPSLFLYLFVAWLVLIGLLALVMESTNGSKSGALEPPAPDEDSGPDLP